MILRYRVVMFLEHIRCERIKIKKHECPVMVNIITLEPVEDRSLRRNGLQCRMA